MITLTVIKGDDEGKVFSLAEGETKIIGRGSASGVLLTEAGVSRNHSKVRVANGVCLIQDAGSRNGTTVNGRKITGEVRLADDDVIDLGNTRIGVKIQAIPPPKPPPKPAPARVPPASPPPAARAEVVQAPPSRPPQAKLSPVRPMPSPGTRLKVEETEDSVKTVDSPPRASAPPVAPSAPGAVSSAPGPARPVAAAGAPRVAAKAPPAAKVPGPASPPHQGAPGQPLDLLGEVVGGCRVDDLLGGDEISHLYVATQVSMERQVSLKVLNPSMTKDSQAVERFLMGARAGGRLSHPNIVQVYDAGTDHGVYFIALEYTGGKSVREMMDELAPGQAMRLRTAVEIVEQIAGALDYIHSQSVLHRHVSPANIVVTEHGIAKLANLGFARGLAESGLSAALSPAERIAEVQFVAPELLADPRAASPASDIYSLGAVLYLTTSGQKPFRGTGESDLVEKVRAGIRLPVTDVRNDLPEDLPGIIESAMAVKPADRIARAAEMQSALLKVRERLRR